jgi:hypothetical protein
MEFNTYRATGRIGSWLYIYLQIWQGQAPLPTDQKCKLQKKKLIDTTCLGFSI